MTKPKPKVVIQYDAERTLALEVDISFYGKLSQADDVIGEVKKALASRFSKDAFHVDEMGRA